MEMERSPVRLSEEAERLLVACGRRREQGILAEAR
jgi:hypothetical protein